MTKFFAPDYDRDAEGRVLFPRDTGLRRKIFPFTDPTEHVAKANMLMVEALVKFVSEPGELILDPFAGTGTILVALTLGRPVIMIEIEEYFQGTIELNIKGISKIVSDAEDMATLIPGDCSRILPLPDFCNHMIFSPPYSNIICKTPKDVEKSQVLKDWGYASSALYTASPDNIGRLPDFMYHQVMEKVYKKCFDSIISGGTLTIIIKDRIEKRKRVPLGKRAERDCIRIGFEPVAWNKHLALGGAFAGYNRSVGLETVDEEDLITLRKP